MMLISCTAAGPFFGFPGVLSASKNHFFTLRVCQDFICAEGLKSASDRRRKVGEVSVSSLVGVLLQAENSRWMTAALFGPVGSQTNNPIMLPGEIRRTACHLNSHRRRVQWEAVLKTHTCRQSQRHRRQSEDTN